jgi:hypothetical protein
MCTTKDFRIHSSLTSTAAMSNSMKQLKEAITHLHHAMKLETLSRAKNVPHFAAGK